LAIIINKIKKLLFLGGIKLKLISFVLLAILITVTVQNLFTLPIIKTYIEQKAFEVSTTTIDRISDFSSFALLERTYENRLSLDEAIKKIKNSNINGLMGISIYQKQKNDDNVSFNHLSGFGFDQKYLSIDEELLKYSKEFTSDKVTYSSHSVDLGYKTINTYRFVKPITYSYQQKKILLGFTILYYDKEAINSIVQKMIDLIVSVTISSLLLATLFVYFIGVDLQSPYFK